jgi:hypothetical protein
MGGAERFSGRVADKGDIESGSLVRFGQVGGFNFSMGVDFDGFVRTLLAKTTLVKSSLSSYDPSI